VIALALLTACTSPQEPIFKRLEGVKTSKLSTKEITITGQAIYHNPNGLGLTLEGTDIDVIVDGITVAKIQQDLEVKVPAQAEFSVPITFSAKPQDVYQANKGGVIGGAINALLNKKVKVRYQGTITVRIAGIKHTTPIDYEEEVALR